MKRIINRKRAGIIVVLTLALCAGVVLYECRDKEVFLLNIEALSSGEDPSGNLGLHEKPTPCYYFTLSPTGERIYCPGRIVYCGLFGKGCTPSACPICGTN